MPWGMASTSKPTIQTESPRLKELAKLASMVLSGSSAAVRSRLAIRLGIEEADVFVELAREYLRLTS